MTSDRTTTATDYWGFDRPAVGDDWAANWDKLVELLDDQAARSGPTSNRPADPPAGSFWLSTDEKLLYLYDGTDWTEHLNYNSGDSSGSVDGNDIAPASVTQADTGAPIEGSVVEAFEAGTLGHYSGDTGAFEIVQSSLYGDWMAEATYPDVGGSKTSFSIQSDAIETRRGMTYSSFVQISSAGGSVSQGGPVLLASWDADGALTDGYVTRINYERQEIEVLKWQGGNFVNGSRQSIQIDNGTWYRIEASAHRDRIATRLYDEQGDLVGQYEYIDDQEDAAPLAAGNGYGWYTRCDTQSDTVAFDLLSKQSIASTPNHSGVNSPDIGRIFVRDTDPASEYELYDGYDYWIDTS